jgi:hypothetical protein
MYIGHYWRWSRCKIKDKELDSREAWLKLKPHGNPYFRSLGRTTLIGYKRLKGRDRTWPLRRYLGNGQYSAEAIGAADDYNEADGNAVLTRWQVEEKEREHTPTAKASPYRVTRGATTMWPISRPRGSMR